MKKSIKRRLIGLMAQGSMLAAMAMIFVFCIPHASVSGATSDRSSSPRAKVKPKDVSQLVWDIANPPMLVAWADGGAISSIDDGISWQRLNGGGKFDSASVKSIQSDLSGGVIVWTESGYFGRSRSDGSWRLLPLNPPPKTRLWFVPGDRKCIYAGRAENFFKSSENDALFTTHDLGQTWTEVQMPGGRVPWNLAVAPQVTAVLYASAWGDSRLWRSSDAAKTWKQITMCQGGNSTYPCLIVVDPLDANTVYARVNDGIEGSGASSSITVDGGTTWGSLVPRSLIQALVVLPTKPTTLIVQAFDTSNYIDQIWQMSTDGGAHWTRIGKGLPSHVRIMSVVTDPARPQFLFAGTEGKGVYRSIDGGATWVPSRQKP